MYRRYAGVYRHIPIYTHVCTFTYDCIITQNEKIIISFQTVHDQGS